MNLPRAFRDRYAAALGEYLAERDEGSLNAAYELGREAVSEELAVLDLAAVHNEALVEALELDASPAGVTSVTRAAGDFFLESLSAFEMLQRGFREAREQAILEQRHAAILRQLSSFLADASLALDSAGSLEELLQLVAEHAREILAAKCCVAVLSGGDTRDDVVVVSSEESAESWGDSLADVDLADMHARVARGGVVRLAAAELEAAPACRPLVAPREGARQVGAWLAVSLRRLDGREMGAIHAFHDDRRFSDVDEAVLVHLAQMASAALERSEVYRAPAGHPSLEK